MIQTTLTGTFSTVSSDSTHFYIAGSDGVEIVNKTTGASGGYLLISGGVNDLWTGDISFVYLGTNHGLYRLEKPGNYLPDVDLTDRVSRDNRSDHFLSQEVISVDGSDRGNLLIGTSSGIEYLNALGVFHSDEYYPVNAVKIASSDYIFYGGEFGLARKDTPISANWTDPEYLVDYPFLSSSVVNEIDSIITEEGEMLVGVATSSGITIINNKEIFTVSPTTRLFKVG